MTTVSPYYQDITNQTVVTDDIDVDYANITNLFVGNVNSQDGVSTINFSPSITVPTMIGNLVGNVDGNVTGDLEGDVTGNLTGNVLGNLTGDVLGNLTGTVTGNVIGNVTGNLTGNVTGNVTGTSNMFTGNLAGQVTGPMGATLIGNGVITDGNINVSAGIQDTKLATIVTSGKVANSATTATSSLEGNAIMARDPNGDFTANTANLSNVVIGGPGSFFMYGGVAPASLFTAINKYGNGMQVGYNYSSYSSVDSEMPAVINNSFQASRMMCAYNAFNFAISSTPGQEPDSTQEWLRITPQNISAANGAVFNGNINSAGQSTFQNILTKAGTGATGNPHIYLDNVNATRIAIGLIGAESSSNAGSNFAIFRYVDGGAYLGEALEVSRSTGLLNALNGITTTNLNATNVTTSNSIASTLYSTPSASKTYSISQEQSVSLSTLMIGRGSGLDIEPFLITYSTTSTIGISGIIDYTAMNSVDCFFGTYSFVAWKTSTTSTTYAKLTLISSSTATGSTTTITVTPSLSVYSGGASPIFTTSNGSTGSGGFTVNAIIRANVMAASSGITIQTFLIP